MQQDQRDDSPNQSVMAGGKNERRGTWYVTDGPAIHRIPFDVHEASFYNFGLYAISIGFGNPIVEWGERNWHYEKVSVQPGEVLRDFKPQHPTGVLIVCAAKNISKLYYLLRGVC
ncbi:hypothetical protein [Numidum massiliense]|uniref:hypothetical protein n=1 Tax=Numidum massiliense TaxID=1522315 RepID=UPI0006D57EBB|nr:hypothetical protein [Numidum massiliense]